MNGRINIKNVILIFQSSSVDIKKLLLTVVVKNNIELFDFGNSGDSGDFFLNSFHFEIEKRIIW